MPVTHPDSRDTAGWASLFPMLVSVSAALPVFRPGQGVS